MDLFKKHHNLDNVIDWHRRGLTRSGYLDDDRQIEYFFHGNGCRITFSPALTIDWDFGTDGGMTGINKWKLMQFLGYRTDLQQILPVAALEGALTEAVRDGSVLLFKHFYYIADEPLPTWVQQSLDV
jgi:hypothetical protein